MKSFSSILNKSQTILHSSSRSFATATSTSKSAPKAQQPSSNPSVSKFLSKSFKDIRRREKEREAFTSYLAYESQDDDIITLLPGWEKAANINWLFNAYDITPSGLAFQNLNDRALNHLSHSKGDNKANDSKSPAYKNYTVGNQLNQDQFDDLKEEVVTQLSDAPYLFLQDGTLNGNVTRVFTDDAATALTFKFESNSDENNHLSTILEEEVNKTKLKVYISSSVKLPASGNYGVSAGNGIIFNKETGDLIILGSETSSFQSALNDAASQVSATSQDKPSS